MSRFRATPDNANFLLAGASKLETDVSAVRIVDGYLTAPEDVVKEAYKQGLDKGQNLDPDDDPEADLTAADSLAEGRAALEEENFVKAEAEGKATADAQAEADKAAEEALAAETKAANTRTRTAKKAAAKKATATRATARKATAKTAAPKE
jgi:hypothetical protein